MDYKHITVAGSGILGSQIAYQTAFHGFQVCVYDVSDAQIEVAKNRIINLKLRYQEDLGVTEDQVNIAYNRITFSNNLEKAVSNADLVIEAIPEVLQIKNDFFKELGKIAPKNTVFATNTSSLLPSQFTEVSGRPEKFLALHFANEIWKHNVAEIMKHPGTDEVVFHDVITFAKAIGMVAIPLQKEQPGYILNSLSMPLLENALLLLVKEVADVDTIDKTWRSATGASLGPFAIMDIVGIQTTYHISLARAEATKNEMLIKIADLLKNEYIKKGKLGKETGEGFYKYTNPDVAIRSYDNGLMDKI